jgi:uncharacterized protein HemX
MKKQVIAISLVLIAVVSVGIAGVVFAQTQNATTDQATTASTTSATTATSDASSCTCPRGHALVGMHGPAIQDTSSRQQLKSWYQQLPQDQKTALQNDLQQAYKTRYQQLPQDQKDKLQTILSQLPQNATNTIEGKLGIQL